MGYISSMLESASGYLAVYFDLDAYTSQRQSDKSVRRYISSYQAVTSECNVAESVDLARRFQSHSYSAS